MALRRFLAVIGIYSIANGIVALLIPASYAAPFGVRTDAGGLAFARYLGACALGLGTLIWSARKQSPSVLRPVLIGGVVTFGTAMLVGIYSIISGVINLYGWLLVMIDLAIVLGFGYFLFTTEQI